MYVVVSSLPIIKIADHEMISGRFYSEGFITFYLFHKDVAGPV